jgi:hypothetical protein
MTVNAHFDGKAIIPDEPLDMPPNRALIVQIERVGPREPAEDSALAWLAANAVENDALPTDLADQHDHYPFGRRPKDQLPAVDIRTRFLQVSVTGAKDEDRVVGRPILERPESVSD